MPDALEIAFSNLSARNNKLEARVATLETLVRELAEKILASSPDAREFLDSWAQRTGHGR